MSQMTDLFCPEVTELVVASIQFYRHNNLGLKLMPKKYKTAEERREARLVSKQRYYTRCARWLTII